MALTGYQPQLVAAMVVFLIINSAAVVARLHVRLFVNRGFGLDDVAILLTYVGYLILCAMGWTAMYYGYAASPEAIASSTHYDEAKSDMFYFANQTTLYICAGLVKIAVALILYRLASTRHMRILILASMVVVVLWTIIMTVFSSYICASGGTSNFASSETCGDVGMFRTVSNIFIDYFYALLPIWMLRKVQMSTRLKVTVCLLLGMGIFASSATIVKLVVIVRLQTATGAYATKLHYDLLLWADIELGMALFAAACAALRPLLKHLPRWGTTFRSSHGGGASGKSSGLGRGGRGKDVLRSSTTGRSNRSAGVVGTGGSGGGREEFGHYYEVSGGDDERGVIADDEAMGTMGGRRFGTGGDITLTVTGTGIALTTDAEENELDRLDSRTGRALFMAPPPEDSDSGSHREILRGKGGSRV